MDLLLPYPGLWEPLKVWNLREILDLRCPEVGIRSSVSCGSLTVEQSVQHYLTEIHNQWSSFFGENEAWAVDPASVRLIEGRMPTYSDDDRSYIAELMDSGRLFPLVPQRQQREALSQRLRECSGRILSFSTLVQDSRYLKLPARAFQDLVPFRKKDTIRTAMLRSFKSTSVIMPELQTSEYTFQPAPATSQRFLVAIIQLWLFALRHFVQPLKSRARKRAIGWTVNEQALKEMAVLASRLGFSSDNIDVLLSLNANRTISERMFRAICTENFYVADDRKIRSVARQFNEGMRSLARVKEGPAGPPKFTTDQPEEMARRRFNSPENEEYLRDRAQLFLGNVYALDQPSSQYPSSFAVTREIIFAFFGKEPLYGIICQAQDQNSATDVRSSLGLGVPSESRDEAANDDNTGNVEEGPESTPLTGHQNDCVSNVEIPPEENDIELLPHPPGTPDRDRMYGIENDVPLASGFEEHIGKAPLNQKAEITLHRKAVEILQTWYRADVQNLIVLFLFESRSYFKFSAPGGSELRSTLRDLSKEHYFLVYDPDSTTEITHVEGDVAYDKARQHRLIFVGKQDCPLHEFEDQRGQISVDYLEKYLSHYDVKTGKRKNNLQSGRQRKRRAVEASR